MNKIDEYDARKHWELQIEKLCDYINNVLKKKTGIKVNAGRVKKLFYIEISKGDRKVSSLLVDPLHEGYSEKMQHDFVLGIKYALQFVVDDI